MKISGGLTGTPQDCGGRTLAAKGKILPPIHLHDPDGHLLSRQRIVRIKDPPLYRKDDYKIITGFST